MLQNLLIDKILKIALKELSKQIKPLQKYVDEPNELDDKVVDIEHRLDVVESAVTGRKKKKCKKK